jgi:hypothetical protein
MPYVGAFEGANASDTVYGSASYDITFTGSAFAIVATYVQGHSALVPGSTDRQWHVQLQHIHRQWDRRGDTITISGSVMPDSTLNRSWSASNFGYRFICGWSGKRNSLEPFSHLIDDGWNGVA